MLSKPIQITNLAARIVAELFSRYNNLDDAAIFMQLLTRIISTPSKILVQQLCN